MDGVFYGDLREPFIVTSLAPVTLAATNKALYTVSDFPILGGQYFNRHGKKMRIRIFGRMTTALTPGNLTFGVYFGSGADANGVLLASSAAAALIASKTNLSWELDVAIRCVTRGSAGTLQVTGGARMHVGLVLSTAQPILIPDSASAPSGACDLNSAGIISVQMARSGSTVETAQIDDMEVYAKN